MFKELFICSRPDRAGVCVVGVGGGVQGASVPVKENKLFLIRLEYERPFNESKIL